MKSNIDMYNENTMVGRIAGTTLSTKDYQTYYSDATKDLDDKNRRIKNNYLIEKLKEHGSLEEFEYKYIYDASACNHMKKFMYNVIPTILFSFLFSTNILFKIITTFLLLPLLFTVIYNILYWIPALYMLKKTSQWINSCFIINFIAVFIDVAVVYFCITKFY